METTAIKTDLRKIKKLINKVSPLLQKNEINLMILINRIIYLAKSKILMLGADIQNNQIFKQVLGMDAAEDDMSMLDISQLPSSSLAILDKIHEPEVVYQKISDH